MLIRDHFSVYWQTYLGVTGAAAILVISFFVYRAHLDRNLAVSKWPEASAKILETKLNDFISQGSKGTGHKISVNLLLRYKAGSLTYESRYFRTFSASPMADYHTLFQPGHDVVIRYDPADPTIVSLYPTIPE